MAIPNSMSNYPGGFGGGVTIQNVPVVIPHSGKVLWVDSGSSLRADGTFKRPFATLALALDECSADNGDIIYVKAGHAESVASDGAIAIDVDGVTIIGLGNGEKRPTFTVATAATATFEITADDVRFFNCRFVGNKDDLATVVEISGDHCEFAFNEVIEGAAGMLIGVTVGVADGDADSCWLHHNVIRMDEAGVTNVGDAGISIAKDMAGIRIEDNHIYGDFDDAGINVPVGGNACTQLTIARNYIENVAAGQHAIQINTAGTMTGQIVNNTLVADAVPTIIEPHTLQCVNNYGALSSGGATFPVPAYRYGMRAAQIVTNATGSMASGYGASDDPTEFTVSGVVAARAWGVVTTAITSTCSTGTLSLGVADANALFVPAITMNGTNGAEFDVLSNATTTVNGDVLENDGNWAIIANGVDIKSYIATNDMTAGAVTWYVEWYPLSSDGNIVAA